MKTLYVSDLDGTLLGAEAEITAYTAQILHKISEKGYYFTAATARTYFTVRKILSGVPLGAPLILMNGALIYDTAKGEYIQSNAIDGAAATRVIEAMEETGFTGFIYGFTGKEVVSHYTELLPGYMTQLYASRLKFQKTFRQVESLKQGAAEYPVVYVSAADVKEKVEKLYEKVKTIPNISYVFYNDTYYKDLWYLEVFSHKADKRRAVEFIKNRYGFERVVAFGDNNNDLPMFQTADECYAVAGSVQALKDCATAVIGSNTEDGVARWLEKNLL